jgi:hypothetical protein
MKHSNHSITRSVLSLFIMVLLFQCVATQIRANDKTSPPYELLTADVDSYQVVIHGKDGTWKWVYDKVRCIDTWLLSNDQILIAYLPSAKTQNKGGVRIVSKSKKILFDYPLDEEVMSCCPLPNGNILFTENKKGVLSELTRQGKILRQIPLKSKGMGHKSVRFIRLTPQNTILAAECYSNIIREYNWQGEVINTFPLKMAYAATRLANGHTLVTGYEPAQVVQFDKTGKIIWKANIDQLTSQGVDFGKNVHFCEIVQLPSGNILIANCQRKNTVGQTVVVEFTPQMKLIRQWKSSYTTKGITAAKPILALPKPVN